MVPDPTPIFRLLHIDNLEVCLQRGALHAPNHTPQDGLTYRTIHNIDIQSKRHIRRIPCGPGGVIHDYVSFYFGPRSPMLFQLYTGRVPDYTEGQRPLVYIVSTAQAIASSGTGFAFSDGHGIATFTNWYADLGDLAKVDWNVVYAEYWADTVDDMDRQRRKQAEFLVHRSCSWELIQKIGVFDDKAEEQVISILKRFPQRRQPNVAVSPRWYY